MSWVWRSISNVTEKKPDKKEVKWKAGDDEDTRIYNTQPSENGEPTTQQPCPLSPRQHIRSPGVIIITRTMYRRGPGVGTRSMMNTEQYDSGLCLAVLSVFCCFPLGILAVFKSTLSVQAMSEGDVLLAERFARSSKTFSFTAILIGICVWWLVPYSMERRRGSNFHRRISTTNSTAEGLRRPPLNNAGQDCLEPMVAYLSLAFSTLMTVFI